MRDLRAYYEDNSGPIAAGSLTNALFYLPAIAWLGGALVVLAGGVGGWVAGVLTARGGPTTLNGAVAGGAGALLATLAFATVGLLSGPLLTTDVLYTSGIRLLRVAPFFVPLFAVEGAVGGFAAGWFRGGA